MKLSSLWLSITGCIWWCCWFSGLLDGESLGRWRFLVLGIGTGAMVSFISSVIDYAKEGK